MIIEGFHNRTGQWVMLYETQELTYSEKAFVTDFSQGGNSHSSIGTVHVNRTHFSAIRIMGGKPATHDMPF